MKSKIEKIKLLSDKNADLGYAICYEFKSGKNCYNWEPPIQTKFNYSASSLREIANELDSLGKKY